MNSPRLIRPLAVLLLLAAAPLFSGEAAAPVDAELVKVPDVWKRAPSGSKAGGEGHAWFRCVVDVPSGWKGEKLEIFAEPVDDAREIYVGGRKVGAAGDFPPTYRSGLGGPSRFSLPAEAVTAGEPVTIAIRVYVEASRTNFNVAAPVLFGEEEAIRLEGSWQFLPGDDGSWARFPAQGKPPAKVVFSRVEPRAEVEQSLRKIGDDDLGPLPPQESRSTFTTPDDLMVELALSEPLVRQPLSMKWDERGRLWVVQYIQYPDPAGLTMVSRDKFLRSVYDKIPPAPPNHFRGEDKITIHEDTDGDGVLDKHKTFVEGLSLASSIAIGRGGVWVLNPPYLLFYPDTDHDDVPDGDPVVHLEGFGIEDSHSIANNLRWGPDGWLYAAQGSTVTGQIRRPDLDKPEEAVHSMGQLIWRYHPRTRRYEIFAEGGGNAFGVEIDSKGRIFSGHNGGDTRGFHYVQGGYFRKGFGKHGELSNPFAFGYFPHMSHAAVPRFTHAFVIYEGAALPERYHGRLFGVAPLQSHVVFSEIFSETSTFQTRDLGYALESGDPWMRPVDIQAGPDGAIYVADFYEQRIDHASHYQGRVHKESGRIWRLRGKDAEPSRPEAFDYGRLTSPELLKVLSHENKWHRQTALRLLGDRRDESVTDDLLKLAEEETGQLALEALWALNLSGGFNEQAAAKLLSHDDPFVRLWTVRLLCDEGSVPEEIAQRLVTLAGDEPQAEVRSQLASSARRLPAEPGLEIVRSLLRHSEDTSDLRLPLLLWWAIEPVCESEPQAVLELFQDEAFWDRAIVKDHISERVMRRFAQSGTRRGLLMAARLLELSPSKGHTARLMKGFELAYEGRTLEGVPPELVTALAKTGGASPALRLRQGDEKAVAEALETIADEKAERRERVLYINILGQIDAPQSVGALLELVEKGRDDDVRGAALGALATYADPRIADTVIAALPQFTPDLREAALGMLAGRGKWALALLEAVDAGRVRREMLPEEVVRRILFHDDERLAALVKKHWGDLAGATTEEMRAEIERFAGLIHEGSGNPYDGKKLFAERCGKCHTLFNEGGRIGPDLTPYKRDDLGVILLNVVNPSAEIREGYENFVVFTEDGRTLSGFIADRDNNVVVIKAADGQSTVIENSEIDEMRAVPRSVMPEGILKDLTPQQVRDLFAYLRATQPLN